MNIFFPLVYHKTTALELLTWQWDRIAIISIIMNSSAHNVSGVRLYSKPGKRQLLITRYIETNIYLFLTKIYSWFFFNELVFNLIIQI